MKLLYSFTPKNNQLLTPSHYKEFLKHGGRKHGDRMRAHYAKMSGEIYDDFLGSTANEEYSKAKLEDVSLNKFKRLLQFYDNKIRLESGETIATMSSHDKFFNIIGKNIHMMNYGTIIEHLITYMHSVLPQTLFYMIIWDFWTTYLNQILQSFTTFSKFIESLDGFDTHQKTLFLGVVFDHYNYEPERYGLWDNWMYQCETFIHEAGIWSQHAEELFKVENPQHAQLKQVSFVTYELQRGAYPFMTEKGWFDSLPEPLSGRLLARRGWNPYSLSHLMYAARTSLYFDLSDFKAPTEQESAGCKAKKEDWNYIDFWLYRYPWMLSHVFTRLRRFVQGHKEVRMQERDRFGVNEEEKNRYYETLDRLAPFYVDSFAGIPEVDDIDSGVKDSWPQPAQLNKQYVIKKNVPNQQKFISKKTPLKPKQVEYLQALNVGDSIELPLAALLPTMDNQEYDNKGSTYVGNNVQDSGFVTGSQQNRPAKAFRGVLISERARKDAEKRLERRFHCRSAQADTFTIKSRTLLEGRKVIRGTGLFGYSFTEEISTPLSEIQKQEIVGRMCVKRTNLRPQLMDTQRVFDQNVTRGQWIEHLVRKTPDLKRHLVVIYGSCQLRNTYFTVSDLEKCSVQDLMKLGFGGFPKQPCRYLDGTGLKSNDSMNLEWPADLVYKFSPFYPGTCIRPRDPLAETAHRYNTNSQAVGFFSESMPEPMVCRMLICALDGLIALKSYGAYHGDLKPSNIIVAGNIRSAESGLVHFKLTDYGTTGELQRSYCRLKKSPENGYKAPEKIEVEQAKGVLTLEQNFQCDIWSLGMCVYLTSYNRFPSYAKPRQPSMGKQELLDWKKREERNANQTKTIWTLLEVQTQPKLNGIKRIVGGINVTQYTPALNEAFDGMVTRAPEKRATLEQLRQTEVYREYSRVGSGYGEREEYGDKSIILKDTIFHEGLDSSTFPKFDLAAFICEILNLKKVAKNARVSQGYTTNMAGLGTTPNIETQQHVPDHGGMDTTDFTVEIESRLPHEHDDREELGQDQGDGYDHNEPRDEIKVEVDDTGFQEQ